MKRQELEKMVLGSIVNNYDLLIQVFDVLHPDMFTGVRKDWAKAILSKTLDGKKVSYHSIFSSTEEEHHTELDKVFFEYNNRDAVELTGRLRESYATSKTLEALKKANNSLLGGDNSQTVQANLINDIDDLRNNAGTVAKDEQRYENAKEQLFSKAQYFTAGSPYFVEKTGGHPVGMNIWAARPGMGKTTHVLWELIYAVRNGEPAIFYSLEMSTELILTRMACYWCGFNANDIHRMNDSQKGKVADAIDEIKNSSLYIRDLQDFSGKVEDLVSDLFVMVNRFGVTFCAIDYLQLLGCYNEKRLSPYQKTSEISTYITRIANKLKLPIIMLCQLSRAVEARPDKRPMLSDLRESGQIEQDATTVTFIYRPEYYNIFEDEQGCDLRGMTELIVGKHRIDGSRVGKKIELWFNPGTGVFALEDDKDFADPARRMNQKADLDIDLPF